MDCEGHINDWLEIKESFPIFHLVMHASLKFPQKNVGKLPPNFPVAIVQTGFKNQATLNQINELRELSIGKVVPQPQLIRNITEFISTTTQRSNYCTFISCNVFILPFITFSLSRLPIESSYNLLHTELILP